MLNLQFKRPRDRRCQEPDELTRSTGLMAIPDFDEHGLLPAGIHDCSLEEMKAKFAWNDHRERLMVSCARFLKSEINDVFDFPVCADGSFVTDKECPNDIDVVLELLEGGDAQKWPGFMLMLEHQDRILEQYGVHFRAKLPHGSDFTAFFQYTGHKTAKAKGLDPRHPKGILRVG